MIPQPHLCLTLLFSNELSDVYICPPAGYHRAVSLLGSQTNYTKGGLNSELGLRATLRQYLLKQIILKELYI